MKLFEDDWGEDNSPQDDTQITTTILYYSEAELKEFKRLCKKAMIAEHGAQAQDKGNICDIILNLLRKTYGDPQTQTNTNTAASGSLEGAVLGQQPLFPIDNQ